MFILWITLAWSVVACAAGLWIGASMHLAELADEVRFDVDELLRREFAPS
ncbi:hypothetical protein [Geodermatophilus sp. Leaf369]|nr:hypothetical protein [Geodermatophilus sp. Leaf369]